MSIILTAGSNLFGQLGIGWKVRDVEWRLTHFGQSEESTTDTESVKDIQCGAQFSVLLHNNGTLNICGSLNGAVYPVLSPLEIPLPVRCVQVSCGRKHILLLMERNIVMSWGTGYFGQLGHGDDSSWDSPRMINALEPRRLGCRVESVACGGSHSAALTDSGRVFMWGLNRSGQCGQGTVYRGKSDSVLEPRPVDFSTSGTAGGDMGAVRSIVCGRSHSAALTSTGRVFTWGDAGYGRLGLNDVKKTQLVPAEVTEFRACPVSVLASGDFHMLALTREGEVYSWGHGADGQTGHSTMLNIRLPRRVSFFNGMPVLSVACGATWSSVTTKAGELYSFGYGDGGWLGVSPPVSLPQVELDNLTPTQASALPDSQSEIRCFDSRHSVLRPRLVDALTKYVVRGVRSGAGHAIFFCDPKSEAEQQDSVAGVKQSPRIDSESKLSASAVNSAFGALPLERRCVSEPVSSRYDAKQAHHQLPLPLSAYQLSSAGDASGSNSSLNSIHAQSSSVAQAKSAAAMRPADSSSSKGLSYSSGDLSRKISPLHSNIVTSSPIQSSTDTTAQIFSWVRHKKMSELSAYLAGGGNPNLTDGAGNTPLIVACQNGNLQVCKVLLASRANLNAANHKGNTALHYCFSYGYEDIGAYLIGSGADEFQTNGEGLTCYEGLTHSDLELL